ncbi:MAG: hypothetical protein WBA17_14560 [Saprospiraceae bacterium]
MNKQIAEFIVKSLNEYGIFEKKAYIHEAYSGRYMYGDTTTGIVISAEMLPNIASCCMLSLEEFSGNNNDTNYLMNLVETDYTWDQLGQEYIIY